MLLQRCVEYSRIERRGLGRGGFSLGSLFGVFLGVFADGASRFERFFVVVVVAVRFLRSLARRGLALLLSERGVRVRFGARLRGVVFVFVVAYVVVVVPLFLRALTITLCLLLIARLGVEFFRHATRARALVRAHRRVVGVFSVRREFLQTDDLVQRLIVHLENIARRQTEHFRRQLGVPETSRDVADEIFSVQLVVLVHLGLELFSPFFRRAFTKLVLLYVVFVVVDVIVIVVIVVVVGTKFLLLLLALLLVRSLRR